MISQNQLSSKSHSEKGLKESITKITARALIQYSTSMDVYQYTKSEQHLANQEYALRLLIASQKLMEIIDSDNYYPGLSRQVAIMDNLVDEFYVH